MSHTFAVKWLKAFRESAEAVVALYADDFLFEDPILGQTITSKEELLRVFAPYANKDTENGIGINNFRIDEVVGDERAAIYRWTWHAPTATAFVGVPTNGKVPGARGITFHIYDADGRIKREESFWDCATAVRDLGLPVDPTAVAKTPALV
ncbi:nuclear transport factor 2 family protein [Mycobacterium sp. CVI_P3]|uniref:Nuclear transport factor 2 family protein n=1 Tax=Mycobacterium pinniadriaticum TaxID=2994102 RepID=A0ABT3SGW4_9MYCO|nr:nuclear transport factor 2 family protein [Mycobacterium pinniadriaticum]MCX2932381.1 nuclear transport factor 2 family protein [Mycobacterium pinniadriaticum]MCX2938762.1 nuclear transport factor 2 family protein [Mycobacterium pinniadriaticum]